MSSEDDEYRDRLEDLEMAVQRLLHQPDAQPMERLAAARANRQSYAQTGGLRTASVPREHESMHGTHESSVLPQGTAGNYTDSKGKSSPHVTFEDVSDSSESSPYQTDVEQHTTDSDTRHNSARRANSRLPLSKHKADVRERGTSVATAGNNSSKVPYQLGRELANERSKRAALEASVSKVM